MHDMQVACPAVTSTDEPLVFEKAKIIGLLKKTTKYLQRIVFMEEEKKNPPSYTALLAKAAHWPRRSFLLVFRHDIFIIVPNL